jgi:hypothetical protein
VRERDDRKENERFWGQANEWLICNRIEKTRRENKIFETKWQGSKLLISLGILRKGSVPYGTTHNQREKESFPTVFSNPREIYFLIIFSKKL